jgi:hypothetical protein
MNGMNEDKEWIQGENNRELRTYWPWMSPQTGKRVA